MNNEAYYSTSVHITLQVTVEPGRHLVMLRAGRTVHVLGVGGHLVMHAVRTAHSAHHALTAGLHHARIAAETAVEMHLLLSTGSHLHHVHSAVSLVTAAVVHSLHRPCSVIAWNA